MTVWDDLAPMWNTYRRSPFPEIVSELAKEWKGTILDVGCGNGRNIFAFEGHLTCLDESAKMLHYAKEMGKARGKSAEFVHADVRKIPLPDKQFDYILCIAMLHHLQPSDQHIALNELYRILKPGGKVLLTVWSRWQKKFFWGPAETYVPWAHDDQVWQRYYYLHSPFSLWKVLRNSPFRVSQWPNVFGKNLCCVLQRKAEKDDQGSK